MLRSRPDRYGAIPITIHWLGAILILLALGFGFQAANAIEPAVKAGFLRIHVSAAIIALLLTVFRIIWWWVFDKKPLPMLGVPSWQNQLARGVHLAFDVIILGMSATGVGMVALSGAGTIIFGGTDTALTDFHLYPPRVPHGVGAKLLLTLFFVHIGAALYHQFARRDGLLRRMWYRR
ncbi:MULTISPECIES: cytochrome b [unclassified Phyllobacterium]|uniref:cytochrome b n=1 Tax=unclassified Phyllobacterium TaxID=2638441 RepID=UPI0030130710